MTLEELVEAAHKNAFEKGFWEVGVLPNMGEKLALIHSEVSEALEAHRERGLETWQREDGKPEGFVYELADVVIRIGDLCGAYGLRLEDAVRLKMAFNSKRPHKHGKSY